jgi:hypothetical protein
VIQSLPTPPGCLDLRFAMLLLLSLGLLGCGSSTTHDVRGKVTIQDTPLKQADIRYAFANDPEKVTYVGISNDDGQYILDTVGREGLPPGTYTVTVTWYTHLNNQPFANAEEAQALKETGQVLKHVGTFTREVTLGSNTIDLDLSKTKITSTRPGSEG